MAVKFGPVVFEDCGAIQIPHWFSPHSRLLRLRAGVLAHLPKAWQSAIGLRAKLAHAPCLIGHDVRRHRQREEGDTLAQWLKNFASAQGADLSESDIRDRAELVAARGRAAGFVADVDGLVDDAWARLMKFFNSNGAVLKLRVGCDSLMAYAARAGCAKFWRRHIRRWVAQENERGSIELALVGARAGSWYCSNAAVRRRMWQNASNEAAMRSMEIESATGQAMTVWDAAQLSVSNKAIRRGELMTRIRGCEQWAEARGLAGIFTTNTCPSRFHAQLKTGGRNPKYKGESPADAQAWLSKQWAKARAKLARDGVGIFGFRVAEPHHDGCPHWHMLLWCKPQAVDYVGQVLRKYWLSEDGQEPGAERHRLNVKAMIPGQASGYIAKYISKNIDDAHIDKHVDDGAPGLSQGPDLLGDMEVKPCQRVEAWAATWRIRQFQAVGQPSVTVWRELRRVPKAHAVAGGDGLLSAWLAVHRQGERRADWARYLEAQGGVCLPGKDYRLCVHHVDRERRGRYGQVVQRWACGVLDRTASGLPVIPTRRERWGGLGFAVASGAPPWTRLNNCTAHNRAALGKASEAVHALVNSGLLDREGGFLVQENYGFQDYSMC